MRTKVILGLFVFLLAPALMAPACGEVLDDPTFRLWCGDELCAWKTEKGAVRRAPTWHKSDYGVELVDTPTVISQSVSSTPKCVVFTAVADVDPSAQVTIGLDFNRDGTVEAEQPIAATGFRSARTEITTPTVFDGIRFVISKRGQGRTVLAEVRAQYTDNCSAPPVEMKGQPLGTPCGGDGECRSGVCCGRLCSECCSNGPESPRTCQGGVRCERRAKGIRGPFIDAVPSQCDGGKGTKPKGAECVAGADCASGACEGARAEAYRAVLRDGKEVLDPCTPSFPDPGGDGCAFMLVVGGVCR